jgi:hypothetical protein
MNSPLTIELETALLRELRETWREINGNYFQGRLRPPVFMLSDVASRLGQWDSNTRTISIHRGMVLQKPWAVVREVLKHESAHQFVNETLEIHDQSAHGPAFETVCRERGFDSRANGLPDVPADEPFDSPILRRIKRLLALAESPNLHEAEAAMNAAQRLMLKHNIDATVAAANEGYSFIHLGQISRRVEAAEHVLAGILGQHFFVDPIWVPSYLPAEGKSGRVLEVAGTHSNLEVARYVHGFLLETAERLWREHQHRHGITKNVDRRRFLVGVMMGFDEKLKQANKENQREGLIWVGDPNLEAYSKKRYPRRRGGSGIGVPLTQAFEHGRQAGRTIVLHKTVRESQSRGRLLGAVGGKP